MAGVWIFGGTQSTESIGLSESGLALLRSEVREIIRPTCGSCHTSTLPTAKPKAVVVFDLKNEDWSATMQVEQLKKVDTRIKDFSTTEKEKIDKLISAELARR